MNDPFETPIDAANSTSPERAAAVAEIRQKAAAAQSVEPGPVADAEQFDPPPGHSRRTYAQVRAIETELRAIAAARNRTSSAAELAELRKRAAELEEMRRQAGLDVEPDTGSTNE